MKLIKILMLCVVGKEAVDIIRTALYVALMMGVIIFICIICTLMNLIS